MPATADPRIGSEFLGYRIEALPVAAGWASSTGRTTRA